jgi:ATP-dependent clp protease proteolytic subunit 1
MNDWLCTTLALHTGKSADEIKNDIQRDKILTAEAAKEYGLVDQVLSSRKSTSPA